MIFRFDGMYADGMKRETLFADQTMVIDIRRKKTNAENLFVPRYGDNSVRIQRIICAIFYHNDSLLYVKKYQFSVSRSSARDARFRIVPGVPTVLLVPVPT